jgi:glycosyltransferase involved in cell wall biosynthesis
MMKVAFVTTHPVQYQVPLFRSLAQAPDVELTVFYAMIPDPTQQGVGFSVAFEWDVPLLEGYRYEVLPNRTAHPMLGRFSGCDTPDVGSRLQGFDAVIIHGWGVRSALQALWGARRRGIPCILRGEASIFRPWPRWRNLTYRVLLRQYAALLAIGRANRAFYEAHGIAPEKIVDAPYCVDNAVFDARARSLASSRAAIREGWRIAADAVVFLFSGKLVPKKRPLDLIEAMALARRHHPQLHLLIAGDGPLRQACAPRAAELGVPATFAGFLNQTRIAEAYVASDCLVLPSDHGETWGLVVNEAMACGRPAIVSDRVGCHPDLVTPGVTGDVFGFGDVEDLARKLSEWADARRLSAAGEHARQRIRLYSVDRAAKGTLAAVELVARGSKA